MKTRKIGLFLLILISLAATSLQAAGCKSLLSRIPQQTSYFDFRDQAQKLNHEFIKALRTSGPTSIKNFKKVSLSTSLILYYALENAVQHGSESRTDPRPTLSRILADKFNLYISIASPQIKGFPVALLGEFTVGDSVYIPPYQKVGHQGSGIAHDRMLAELSNLPQHSSLTWEADGRFVTLTLKLRVR